MELKDKLQHSIIYPFNWRSYRKDEFRDMVEWCSRTFGHSVDSSSCGTWAYRWKEDKEHISVYCFYFLNKPDSIQFALRWL